MARKPNPKSMPPRERGIELPPRVAARLLLAVLAIGLLVAAWRAWDLSWHVEEFGMASDSFGYLQMAADIRAGQAPHGGQKFTADSPAARELIAFFKERGVPAEKWESLVAPGAYHYDARSDKIINQYPPGVPLMLAAFPKGKALATWYHLTLGAILIAGAAVLVWTDRRFAKEPSPLTLLPAAILILALHMALLLLGTTVSYSIDFLIWPLLPAAALTLLAWRATSWRGSAWALLAGVLLGYAVLMRVSAILLLPGFVTCLWPRSWKSVWPVTALVLGVAAIGVWPLLQHQASLTGSLFGSTYAHADTAGPTLSAIGKGFQHYFAGLGSYSNWALFTATLAMAGGVIAGWRRGGWQRGLGQWVLGAVVAWAIPTAYFLTHTITTPYYQLPSTLALLLLLGFGAAAARRRDPEATTYLPERAARQLGVGALLLVAAIHVLVAATTMPPPLDPNPEVADSLPLPEGTEDPHACILADRFAGTFWQVHGVYAMSPLQTDAATRRILFRHLYERGTPVFVMRDTPAMAKLVGEELWPAVRAGEPAERGDLKVAGEWKRDREKPMTIYRVVWPKGGPRE